MAESSKVLPDKTVSVVHTCDSCGKQATCVWDAGMQQRKKHGCLDWWYMMLDESPVLTRRLDFCELACALRYMHEHPEANVTVPQRLSGANR